MASCTLPNDCSFRNTNFNKVDRRVTPFGIKSKFPDRLRGRCWFVASQEPRNSTSLFPIHSVKHNILIEYLAYSFTSTERGTRPCRKRYILN